MTQETIPQKRSTTPLVSVLCLAYNHESYIEQCINGFVMQQCSFPFEVIIHDDASIDKSADIIQKYCSRYPELFVPILQHENQFSKHVPITTNHMFPIARGKYIAFCEADDYWVDPLKLQKQVNFMESHPDYSVCVHGCRLYDEQQQSFVDNQYYMNTPDTIGILDLFGRPFNIASSSLFFKRNAQAEHKRQMMGDMVNINGDTISLFLYAEQGKIKFIPEEMSVYRLGSGIWSTGNWYNRDLNSLITLSRLYGIIEDEEARQMINGVLLSIKRGLHNIMDDYYRVLSSKPYRLGQTLLRPIRRLVGMF